MKSTVIKLCYAILFVSATACNKNCDKDIQITENSKALVPIVVSDSATRVEKYSAEELREHLEKISGAKFEILTTSQADNPKKAIYVGDSPKARQLLGNIDPSKLDFDETIIKAKDGNVVFLGHPKRGTLYAVESFLEEQMGIRWWTSTESFIPKNPSITIKEQDKRYAPVLKLRKLDYLEWGKPRFTARLRVGEIYFKDKQLQFETNEHFVTRCHSFYTFLPPQKYYKTHPEWYSLVGGKRIYKKEGTHDYCQLCLTNQDMRREFLKSVRERLANFSNPTFIHISQNDYRHYCECKNCSDFVKKHGDAQSALTLDFTNYIAKDLEKDYPNLRVVTFAYDYTRKPPVGVVPRDNVWIELCTHECDFAHPLETDTEFGFTPDIKAWQKIAPRITIWNYITNFTNLLYPFPNLNCVAEDIRFFVRNNVRGLYEQSNDDCLIGDFARMRHWVMAHLMWNPNLQTKDLVREFLYGYYTPEVGKHLEKHLWLLNDKALKTHYHQRCYYTDILTWLDIKTFAEASKEMELAMAKAIELEKNDPQKYKGLTKKVRRDKTAFDWYVIMNYSDLKLKADRANVNLDHLPNVNEIAEQAVKVFEEYKIEWLRPPSRIRKPIKNMREIITRAAKEQSEYLKNGKHEYPPKDFADKYPEGSFIEIQEEQFKQRIQDALRIPCEIVADKFASNGYATRARDAESKILLRYRDSILNLKSASGSTDTTTKSKIYAYVSTKGKELEYKHIYKNRWTKIKTGDEYKPIHVGTFTFTPEKAAKKYALCHQFSIESKTPKDFYLDRIVIVKE